ncbi:glycosyltransferase family 4 protein [archaeon]|nr:glycosyltransferase family 4 protein [archaeon]
MKIAFVTPSYYPSIIGASFYCQDIASYLTKMGHEVTVYTKWNHGWQKTDIVDEIEINRIPMKNILDGRFYFSCKMVMEIASKKFDIIHSHHYGYFPATAGLIAAKMRNTPHVFGPYYHPPVYSFARWLQFAMYHFTQGLPLLRMSNKVLPHTEYEMKMLLRVGAKKENMKIVPNIVNTSVFKKDDKAEKENILLFVSNLIRDKGADVAMKIFSKILSERKDHTAVFIGNPYDRRLIPLIEKMKNNRRMIFVENIQLQDLVRWYNMASVVVLPSKYEAFSRVLAEAQACETPVVATKVGGVPDVVSDGKSGFLVGYGDWAEMKNKIDTILDDDKLGKKMGKYGRKHIAERFDTDIIGKKIESIYKILA